MAFVTDTNYAHLNADRRYDGRGPASLSFEIRACPDLTGRVIASGRNLTTEELRDALVEEAKRFGYAPESF